MKILAMSGSLQARSSNAAMVRAAVDRVPEGVEVDLFEGLTNLPHFNPDLDGKGAPTAVSDFRRRLAASDAVLISTPECAHGMPGVLKNALDWVVGSGEFSGKPVAVMSGAPNAMGGVRAQMALLATVAVMDGVIVDSLTVPFVRKKLDEAGRVSDPRTLDRIATLVQTLVAAIRPG